MLLVAKSPQNLPAKSKILARTFLTTILRVSIAASSKMTKSQKKSTRKFEKKHLKDVLERRKGFAKIKQRHQKKEKKRARREKDNAVEKDEDEQAAGSQTARNDKGRSSEAFENMTVDEFFAGGFEVPTIKQKTTGKRKRGPEPVGNNEDAEFSDESVDLDRVESDSGDENQSDEEQAGHKSHLAALAQKDPEFYKYLQENDAELLEFDEDALGALSEGEDEERPKKKQKGNAAPKNTVTLSMVSKWEDAMKTLHSTKAMREVVIAFRAAVYTNEETAKTFKYTISSPEVYHQVLTVAMKQIPQVIRHHLPVKESISGKVRLPTDSKKFQTLASLIMAFANPLLHLLQGLSDDGTIKATLTSIQELLPYLLSFKKVIKTLLKSTTEIWSDTGASEVLRINAFLIIRRLATIGDASIKETLLKTAYQGLIKGSRNTTPHNLPGINLMKNSAVDLWGCDAALAYTTGFTYIRQLAIHLRTTLTKPTKDSYKAIYNWQYVHSLDFWSRALSTHCSPAANLLLKKPSESPLFPLVYPLVQVTLGALRLIPTPTYFPLRFHLVRALLRISRSTNTYIPLVPALMEILQSPEVRDPAKASTIKPMDFSTTLRAAKQYSKTRVYQDGIIEQVSELLAEFFGVWAKSIAFPELIIPPVVLLKRWMKDLSNPQAINSSNKKKSKRNRNPKLISSMTLLIEKLNLNAEFIQRHRRKVEFSPKDREQLDNFLKDVPIEETPMGAFVAAIKERQEGQRRLLDESRRQEDEARRRQGEREEDVRMVSSDEEEEEKVQMTNVKKPLKKNGALLNGLHDPDDGSEDLNEDSEGEGEEDEDGDDDMAGFIDDEAEEEEEEEEDSD